jgi:D-alanyl-D-alanine dipeptidase
MKKLIFVFLLFTACIQNNKQQDDPSAIQPTDTTSIDTVDRKIEQEEPQNPVRIPDYDTSQWVDITFLDNSIVVDMKYATTDNFVSEKMYDCGRCFLRPEVADAIQKIHKELQGEGLGLKVYDCFRPRPIQWKLWEKVPDPRFVSDPKKGSMHNRGAAVDLTLVDQNGKELDMGTKFDYFGKEAYPSYTDLPDTVLNNRKRLSEIMLSNGFKAISTEWWHYSYTKKSYPLSDMLWNCDSVQ